MNINFRPEIKNWRRKKSVSPSKGKSETKYTPSVATHEKYHRSRSKGSLHIFQRNHGMYGFFSLFFLLHILNNDCGQQLCEWMCELINVCCSLCSVTRPYLLRDRERNEKKVNKPTRIKLVLNSHLSVLQIGSYMV